MEYENILVEREDAIAVVTVNRPRVLNTLNRATIVELTSAIDELGADREVRAIIITGAGDRAFVAGADINEIRELNALEAVEFSEQGQALMFRIEELPKPVIAAINGFALGGGCELALACDIRIAAEGARLGQPEINLGVIPGYGGTQRLPREVGRGKAMELILTGEMIEAQEALRIGLVEQVVPPERLLEEAKALARKIAGKGAIAIKLAKRCINQGLETDLRSGCALESLQFGAVCTTEDKLEGTTAFLEKRKPEFKGR